MAFQPMNSINHYLPRIELVMNDAFENWHSMQSFGWEKELEKMTANIATSVMLSDDQLGQNYIDCFRAVTNGFTGIPIKFPTGKYGN